MALNEEKIWAVLDPAFGDDAGKSSIIVRILAEKCGCILAECMNALMYESFKVDHDL